MTTTDFRAVLGRNMNWIIPAGIFLLAAGIRIGFFLSLRTDPISTYPILDAAYYERWARDILSGIPFTEHAYFTEPGYAFLLAAFFRIFDDGKTAIAIFQMLLGSLTPVVIFLGTRKLSRSVGIAAVSGLLAAIAAPPVFYDALLLKTSVELFLLSVIVLAVASFWEKRLPLPLFGTGVIIGTTALVKANILYSVPILAVAILFRNKKADRQRVMAAAMFVLGTALAISPAGIRNYLADGSIAPINASGGPNLYIGSWEGADGSLKPPEFVSVDPEHEESSWRAFAEASLNRQLSSGDVSGFWSRKAVFEEIIPHPVRFIGLTMTKLGLIVSSRVLDDNYFPGYGAERFPILGFLLPAWILIIMGVLGTVLAMMNQSVRMTWLPVAVIALAYTGTLVLAHVAERYRIALFPMLLPGAGYFVVTTFRRIRSGRFLSAFWILIPFLILSGLAFISGETASSTTGPDMKTAIAEKADRSGDRETARRFNESALQENPFHVPSLLLASRIALEENRTGEALSYARRALRADPEAGTAELRTAYEAETGKLQGDDFGNAVKRLTDPSMGTGKIADPNYWTGMGFFRKRDFEKALPFFERASANDPENAAALGNLATCYKNTKQPDLALPLFRRIIEKDPYNLAIRFNLAQFYEAKKDTFAAMKEYEAMQDIVPGFHLARFNIAELALKRNDKNRARSELSAFIKENRGDPRKTQLIREAEQTLERIGK